MRTRFIALVVVAGVAGVGAAAVVGNAGAAPQTVTLGSASGTPNMNFGSCGGSTHCTYVPYSNAGTPELVVPFDGTVTSFSVNSNMTGGTFELRVLRPSTSGFTAIGTSAPFHPPAAGVNTFSVSMPVQTGDVLGLDNGSDAIMFEQPVSPYLTAYYNPALADGITAAPTGNQSGYKLLLEATVQASATTTSTTTTTTTTTGTTTQTNPPGTLSLTNVKQSHRRWREGKKLARFASGSQPPVGTTFRFNLSEPATVKFAFKQQKCGHKCAHGTLREAATAGAHKLFFQGRLSRKKRLPPGHYKLAITATTAAGLHATASTLRFTIVAG